MAQCDGLACRTVKQAHTRAWGEGYRAGYEAGVKALAEPLENLRHELARSQNFLAYEEITKLLRGALEQP